MAKNSRTVLFEEDVVLFLISTIFIVILLCCDSAGCDTKPGRKKNIKKIVHKQ